VLRYVVPSVQGINNCLNVIILSFSMKISFNELVIYFFVGFFKSIALSRGNCLQDTLRLLTLWFKYGYQDEVCNAIKEGFSSVNIDTWLEVIPQVCSCNKCYHLFILLF
jgi:hypothetical protein